ncbi:MAG TPA: transcription antitermination factor NusB [Chthoniobacterales bacterium]
MKESARSLARAALRRWRMGHEFADRIVAEIFAVTALGGPDRAFLLELFYGVLRNLTLLDFWIGQLRSEAVDLETRDLLRLGLYQVMFLETAAHAAVFETVALSPRRARPVVNALLRRALRERKGLTRSAGAQPPAVRYSQPQFLIEKWSGQFGPAAALALCRWNNQPAPVYARINQLKISPPEFLRKYPDSSVFPSCSKFVRLAEVAAVAASGDAYIQDPSTALACELLHPGLGETILDACAAPGGKSAYLAEMMSNTGTLIATDREEMRLARLRANLARLRVANATTIVCDWADEESIRAAGLEKHSFDKIMLDAPCTNTGVMRRRVDLRWRLAPGDFARMRSEQLTVLRRVARFLKPGGSLVYSTCSLEPEENEEVASEFLESVAGFSLTTAKKSRPFSDGMDGAFAVRLHRGA